MRLLLVEDNERVAQFVVKGLQEAGHTTDHAGNGRDGMFLAAAEPYDVIIMDRMLPGDIDGLAIIEVLRKERVAVLLVEQNVPLTLAASERIYIIEKGIVRHHALASELRVNDAVIHQYLGV